MTLSRRSTLALLSASAFAPNAALTKTPRETMWEDLIPPGVPYSEIIAEGQMDVASDFWRPIYDANALKLNEDLNGTYVKIPGFVVPLEMTADGVYDFLLVPYAGACIHTPPPPANQLVVTRTETPWPATDLWEAVWVTGEMWTKLQDTDLGRTGYSLTADAMEVYVW